MSGNGLQGSIPQMPADSYLSVVALSNNRLEGTIPLSVQTSKGIQYLGEGITCAQASVAR